jgi:hypothetical protein
MISRLDFTIGIPEKLPTIRLPIVLYDVREPFGGGGTADAATERWRKAKGNGSRVPAAAVLRGRSVYSW